MNKYILLQKGYCVFGIGCSASDALQNSLQWIDQTTTEEIEYTEHFESAYSGDLVLIECTKELAQLIMSKGGDILFKVYKNTADICE
jgi:hypothetical protein